MTPLTPARERHSYIHTVPFLSREQLGSALLALRPAENQLKSGGPLRGRSGTLWPPVRISPGVSIPAPPRTDPTTPVSLAAPGHRVPPERSGGPCCLRPRCLWLLEAGKNQIKTPQKGRKTKKREAKQRGGRPPGRPSPPAIAYSGVLAQRMHRYYQLEDVFEGENRLKKKNREKKGLFRPRRSHAGGGGGAAAPAPRPPGSPGHAATPSH